jgi:hypothetical protein
MMSRAVKKQELMLFKLKSGKDLDEFGTVIVSLKIEHCHRLTEEDKNVFLVRIVGPQYANAIFNKTDLIENKDQEVTCNTLIEAMYRVWRVSNTGEEYDLKEKELSLANPRYFGEGKKYFHSGATYHTNYQYPNFKAYKWVKCDYP